MLAQLAMVLGFLILWLGIKFLAKPVGGVDEPTWFRSFLWAVVIWFVSTVVSTILIGGAFSLAGGE